MTREMYDATSIEHTLSRFFGAKVGARGKAWDADVFRTGDPKAISQVIEKIADHAEKRASTLSFSIEEQENGGNQKIIQVSISRLRRYGEAFATGSIQREDPHWEILGALVGIIDALLSHLNA